MLEVKSLLFGQGSTGDGWGLRAPDHIHTRLAVMLVLAGAVILAGTVVMAVVWKPPGLRQP